MTTKSIGIIVNGATGGIATRRQLEAMLPKSASYRAYFWWAGTKTAARGQGVQLLDDAHNHCAQ